MSHLTVLAIDGGVGAGKSAAISNLAGKYQRRGHQTVALSSGAFYRAAAWLMSQSYDAEAFESNRAAAMTMLARSGLNVHDGQPAVPHDRGQHVLTQAELYHDAIHHAASVIAKWPEIRAFVDQIICDYARTFMGLLLTDGRDMTLVLGKLLAELGQSDRLIKAKLVVDDEEAARRRRTTVELVRERNLRDAEQTVDDPDAFRLDTTELDELQVTLALDAHICERFPGLAARMVIITGPSGVGKATVLRRVKEYLPQIKVSRSLTTRKQRPGEPDSAYFFVSHEEFQAQIAAGNLLEYAEYSGNYYGTPLRQVDVNWGVLEIERQGAMIVRQKAPSVRIIRLNPPGQTVEEQIGNLRDRLTSDQTTNPRNNIDARLATAVDELGGPADLVVVNKTVDEAARHIAAYI